MNDWQKGGFGLYIHWPFCEAKCPYCDFNSHVASFIDQDRWRNAYLAELNRVARELPGRVFSSIFFGGGTPSLMAPETVQAIIDTALRLWPSANDIEITLEANPSSVEADRFRSYRLAGVNRVSLGVQALNDADLRRLGRLHSAEEALEAVDIAQSTFERSSFDLIYARQNQTLTDWKQELTRALSWGTDHMSLYQLTIEPGTAFGDRYDRGKLSGLPNDDLAADMYEMTQDLCETAGFRRYEISNHARDGAESRHNLIYWRYGDYAGIGPGAHGRVTIQGTKFATETELAPGKWLQMAEAGNGESLRMSLSSEDQAGEYLMMGLRTVEGIDLSRFTSLAQQGLNPEKINDFKHMGLVELQENSMRATPKGMALLNRIVSELLP